MKKTLIAIAVILGVAVVTSLIFNFILLQDKTSLSDELQSAQDTLAMTQSELTATNAMLATTEQRLTSTLAKFDVTTQTLASTQSDLNSTNRTLVFTQSELATAKETLNRTQLDLDATKQELDLTKLASKDIEIQLMTTQQRLARAQEVLQGLGISLYTSEENYDAILVDNATAQNPTLKQVKDFIALDRTEKHPYIKEVYDCSEYSRDVHNNAEAAGIRTAVVQVTFEGEALGHALNAFLTTDYGLVYVDCTQSPDKVVRVNKGKAYRAFDLVMVNGAYIRNDGWWDCLTAYYYMPTHTGAESVVENIRMFW